MEGTAKIKANELAATSRPFTTMGSATLHLDTTQSRDRAQASRKPSTAGAASASRLQATEGEFDVRKFILDQKGTEPLHQSSLFRSASFLEQQHPHLKSRPSTQPNHSSSDFTKRSKKLLPKMEMGSSHSLGMLQVSNDDARKLQGASVNQQHDDEYDTVSHFYTIEKMAESCCHAAQSRNKTWHFLPGSEERSKGNNSSGGVGGSSITGVERPSRRVDVLDLGNCFETAIQFVNKKNKWDVASNEKMAMIDRDFMSIDARVAQKYSSSSPCSGELLPGGVDKSTEDQKVLVKLFFEQKWSDVILGELEAMLTVSFLEQGVLLRKARIQYAQAFYQLEHLYCSRSRELTLALQESEKMRQEILRASENHQRDTDDMKEQYEAEIRRLSVGFEARKEEMEKKVTESKEQMTKMGDTMKTLNTIFRQMREDTEKVKAVELRENYNKLEKKYELCREEIERLRPLIQENQTLTAAKEAVEQELETLKENVSNMSVILAAKDDTIASLMEQQSDMIAAQELQAAQEEERRKRAQDAADDEEDDLGESNSPATATSSHDVDDSSAGPNGPRRCRNSVGVCVRCKQDMKDMSVQEKLVDQPLDSSSQSGGNSNADSFEASGSENRKVQEVRKRRIQCLYFRILLPNLRGRRPHKEMAWTLSCMRSIVFAKQIDDAMCKRNGGIFPLRIQMPEFVYSWFSPWRSIRDEKNQDDFDAAYVEPTDKSDSSAPLSRSILSSEQQQMQADEDRWCLYYGVKALVQEGYLEAKLFLSLLDEKYGEDELVFMLYCYRVLDILIGGRLNWGPLRDCTSYVNFSEQYETLGIAAANGPSTKRVPKTIWISPYHASLATGVVLSKATESERSALDKKIMKYVVNNVPEEEKPVVFLPPDQPRLAKKKHGKKAQPTADPSNAHDKEDDDEDAAPMQFVDANLWVELMMLEYKEEQAHRRAAIRLMFQTATGATTSVVGPSRTESRQSVIALGGISAATMDIEQFRIMIRTLNDEIPSFMVASLFRNAYVKGNGAVNFDAFMDVAESAQFFSSCMRLESPAAGIARLPDSQYLPTSAALSTSSRATYMVGKFFAILRGELASSIEALPLWTRSMADYLSYEISSCLEDSEDAFSDGVRLLTSFHRLVDSLLLTKLVKHEITGCLLHSKNIFILEKALNALLECVRLRDKSSVEILIDTIRQKLCVKRMQTAFREHLRRDQGAPLVMRPLLHHHYGKKECDYHTRVAERPLNWLLYVISAIFRQSMQPERYSVLLMVLSMTSSAFHGTPSSSTNNSSTINGGIGPAPKPILMELIYDFFLGKFGTRWEAEKLIHDVFVNCRAYVKTNAMVMLFSALCSMSNAAPDDRLLGQNEALAFLHGVFRCGLHDFRIINPSSLVYSMAVSGAAENGTGSEANATIEPPDWIPIETAESILLSAFSKLSTDQKQRLRARIEEAAQDAKEGTELALRSSSMTNLKTQQQPNGVIEAGAFLLLALTEWKRYVVQRMNEVKIVCCTLEDEMLRFESFAQIDAIANVLEKSGVPYLSDDLCVIFRRFCSTEKRHSEKKESLGGSSHKVQQSSAEDHISDRLAAACFPMLAREPLTELQNLENSAVEPFKISPNPAQSYEFLVSSWGGYREQCRQLLEELRRIGKNNDIQAESFLQRSSTVSSGNHSSTRDVLYLNSPTSVDHLSSQDVAQHEAVYLLFIERLERLEDLFEKDCIERAHGTESSSSKRDSISVSGDESLSLVDEMHSGIVMVNETWKIFRQVLLGFIRLRALASLGKGTLPDEWSQAT